jgi:hypothetical protein
VNVPLQPRWRLRRLNKLNYQSMEVFVVSEMTKASFWCGIIVEMLLLIIIF